MLEYRLYTPGEGGGVALKIKAGEKKLAKAKRNVTDLWSEADELGIDIGNPRIAGLLAREWLTLDECCQVMEKPPSYRSNLIVAKEIRKTLPGRSEPHGRQLNHWVRPIDFIEWLTNRAERFRLVNPERAKKRVNGD
jgi:hypothetical protein